MTIMRIISRLILQKPSPFSPPRWLSTVTEEATAATQPRKKNLLFYKVLKANSKSSIADILNKWVNQGNDVMRYDIVNLSNYFRSRRNFQAALQLYDWMESSKLEISNANQAIRIGLLCKTEVSEKTNKTYGALLGCYCKERVFDKALEIFEEMKLSNYTSTLNYNNFSLVQEMEEKNIAPDLYTYNLMINSYAALKNLDAIEGILEEMKSNNVEYNLFTCGNLATIYFNSGLHEKANAFLGMMEKMKIRHGEDVFEACRTPYPTLNNTSYLFMLLALSKLGDQENLEKLFKEWEEGCSNYDFRLPNVLLEYYLSPNMIEEATSLYGSLANRGTDPNLRTLKICQIDSAPKYLEMGLDKAKQRSSKWFPTDETIKLFLNYFEENNDGDGAEKFSQSMKKTNRLDSNSLLLNIKAPDAGS
ncbi:hypothetical protein Pfo_005154 [Paulownia fortunei]|nr:hypothetical protein Pfo_005154 [Paulownia fortunei]